VNFKLRVGVILTILIYYEITSYELRLTNYDLSGLKGKNSDLFQIIDYKLVRDFSQNWANSKLVKISQNYHNIKILSNLVEISHQMIVPRIKCTIYIN
jgi:hypothetical protein